MYIDIQDEAPGYFNSRPSSSQGTSDINPSRAVDPDDLSSDIRARFAHLTLTSSQQTSISDSLDSERSQRLKALPACEEVKDGGHKVVEHWNKSFELADQEYLLEDLEPLDNLKKETNSNFIQNQFKALVTFSAAVKSCFKEFQALRKPLDDLASGEHTTVAQQVEAVIKLRWELKKNATTLGKNADIILSSENDIRKFQASSVKKTRNMIESLPKPKESSELATAFLEGIGKYGLSKLAKKNKSKSIASKMTQDVYQEEKSKTEALSQKLDESRNSLRAAHAAWACMNGPIYSNMLVVIQQIIPDGTNVSYMAITNELDEAEGKLLTLIELIDEFLAQIMQEYGLKFGRRQVKRLCSRLPNIFTALAMLLSAKEIVADDHRYNYEEHICGLCKTILEYLKVMQEIHWESSITVNVERQVAFLRDDVPRFRNSVEPHLQGIMRIAEAHICESKSKEAYNKRANQDRLCGTSTLTREERPLVTGDEILWALQKVADAIVLVQTVSSATAASDINANENGNYMQQTTDSLPRIKMPDKMANQFYAVLYNEAEKLRDLKDDLGARQTSARPNCNEEPEHGGYFTRLRRLIARKPR